MASNPPGDCCIQGLRHEGEPRGKLIRVNATIDAYLATAPEDKAHKGAGILYLPDVFGIFNNAKLLADQFADAGYTTLLLDLFNGDTVPPPLNRPPTFNLQEWIKKGTNGDNPHTKEAVDPLIPQGIQALRDLGITKIGSIGVCFGAKYLARHYQSGIHVGFFAHPSFVEEAELAAITGPLSIVAAQTDAIFTIELRHKSEEILSKTDQLWQITVFSGVSHGFFVRGDPTNPVVQFAKEQAFNQAVTWFNRYLL